MLNRKQSECTEKLAKLIDDINTQKKMHNNKVNAYHTANVKSLFGNYNELTVPIKTTIEKQVEKDKYKQLKVITDMITAGKCNIPEFSTYHPREESKEDEHEDPVTDGVLDIELPDTLRNQYITEQEQRRAAQQATDDANDQEEAEADD